MVAKACDTVAKAYEAGDKVCDTGAPILDPVAKVSDAGAVQPVQVQRGPPGQRAA